MLVGGGDLVGGGEFGGWREFGGVWGEGFFE